VSGTLYPVSGSFMTENALLMPIEDWKNIIGLMCLDLCFKIQMIGFRIWNNKKAWIHPALFQWFRLLLV